MYHISHLTHSQNGTGIWKRYVPMVFFFFLSPCGTHCTHAHTYAHSTTSGVLLSNVKKILSSKIKICKFNEII